MTQINKVLVVGAGWSGQQIAAQMIGHGVEVVLTDKLLAQSEKASQWASEFAETKVREGDWPRDQISKISVVDLNASNINDRLNDVDLAIECVFEQAALKKRVLRQLDSLVPSNCIIASNSSYFVPSQLQKFVSSDRQYAHFHFHVPIDVATIVDIVPGVNLTDENKAALMALAVQIGQTPIFEPVENPGYVFNWMLQSTLKSALQLVQRGVATPEQIDLSWKTITGMPLGPFGIMDRIGLDVIEHVLSNARWAPVQTQSEFSNEYEELIALIAEKTVQGNLGTKTGRGFFSYSGGGAPEIADHVDSEIDDLSKNN